MTDCPHAEECRDNNSSLCPSCAHLRQKTFYTPRGWRPYNPYPWPYWYDYPGTIITWYTSNTATTDGTSTTTSN